MSIADTLPFKVLFHTYFDIAFLEWILLESIEYST